MRGSAGEATNQFFARGYKILRQLIRRDENFQNTTELGMPKKVTSDKQVPQPAPLLAWPSRGARRMKAVVKEFFPLGVPLPIV